MSDGNERLSQYVSLLNDASAGRLDGLDCPQCHHPTVSVWFTHPEAGTYRTWFTCSKCTFHTRAQDGARPAFFSEQRVRKDLEEHDLSILNRSIFRKPRSRGSDE